MVAEPKPHQTGRKRQNITKTGNDWDYYYDSYYASTVGCFPPIGPSARLVPPLKRARISTSSAATQNSSGGNNGTGATSSVNRTANKISTTINSTTNTQNQTTATIQKASNNNGNNAQQIITGNSAPTNSAVNNITQNNSIITNNNTVAIDQLKTYSNPDILICGNCREMLTELKELIEHKKTYCKLRFTCKCHTFNSNPNNEEHTTLNQTNTAATTVSLLCVQCKDSFPNAWDLMVHAQAAHMVNIYELGIPKQNNSPNASSNNGNGDDTSSEIPPSSRENSEEKENNKNGSSASTNGIENNGSEEYENITIRSNSPAVNSSNHINNSNENQVIVKQESEVQEPAPQNTCLVHTLTINTMENNVMDHDHNNGANNKNNNITSTSSSSTLNVSSNSTTRPVSNVTEQPSSYQLFVTNGEQ